MQEPVKPLQASPGALAMRERWSDVGIECYAHDVPSDVEDAERCERPQVSQLREIRRPQPGIGDPRENQGVEHG